MENSEIDPYKYSHFIFCRGGRANGAKIVSSTNDAKTIGHLHAKMNLDTDLILITKINSESIIDLNVKCRTIKLLQENTTDN